MDLNLKKSLILRPLNCPMSIFINIKTGIIQRLLKRYVEITSLVITNHPIAETNIVESSIMIDVLRDFLTYCLVKKSPKAAIEIIASGGIFPRLSRVNPNLSITIKKVISESVRIQ
jgi:hypothetical protein